MSASVFIETGNGREGERKVRRLIVGYETRKIPEGRVVQHPQFSPAKYNGRNMYIQCGDVIATRNTRVP